MKVIISENVDVTGTHLQGEMDISYKELCEKLGPPSSNGDGHKVDAEWILKFGDGTIATVYNYKSGPNYNQGAGSVEGIRDWHIGGLSPRAVELVEALIGGLITVS